MSSAGPASDGDIVSSTTRRKSGRVSRKPEKYAPGLSPGGRSKRKRGDDDDGDDSGVDASELLSEEEEQDESSEGEPDEQELRERKRKQKGRARAKKPATKKAKTNGKTVSLAMRPASSTAKKSTTKRPRKAAVRKSTLAEDEPEGLYGTCLVGGCKCIAKLTALQPTCLPVATGWRTLRRDGWRASTSTRAWPWPRLSTWCCGLRAAPSR